MRHIVMILITLLFNGCLPIWRSANGLQRGQLQVSYNPPTSGDIRYGLTNNLEYRYSFMAEFFETDLMYHRQGKIDYSIAVGLIWDPDWEKDPIPYLPFNTSKKRRSTGFALCVSKQILQGVNPYIGYSYSEPTYRRKALNFVAIGVEFTVHKQKGPVANFALTPELQFYPGATGGEFDPPVWASLGLGVNFNTRKLFK